MHAVGEGPSERCSSGQQPHDVEERALRSEHGRCGAVHAARGLARMDRGAVRARRLERRTKPAAHHLRRTHAAEDARLARDDARIRAELDAARLHDREGGDVAHAAEILLKRCAHDPVARKRAALIPKCSRMPWISHVPMLLRRSAIIAVQPWDIAAAMRAASAAPSEASSGRESHLMPRPDPSGKRGMTWKCTWGTAWCASAPLFWRML